MIVDCTVCNPPYIKIWEIVSGASKKFLLDDIALWLIGNQHNLPTLMPRARP